jgi:hypothetical protein
MSSQPWAVLKVFYISNGVLSMRYSEAFPCNTYGVESSHVSVMGMHSKLFSHVLTALGLLELVYTLKGVQ